MSRHAWPACLIRQAKQRIHRAAELERPGTLKILRLEKYWYADKPIEIAVAQCWRVFNVSAKPISRSEHIRMRRQPHLQMIP